jgi:hypothetical protein
MHIINNKRIWIDRPITIDGVLYPHLHEAALRESLGIVEIPDIQPPDDYSDETYFRTEQDSAPYTLFTRKPDSMIAEAKAAKLLNEIDSLERQQLMPRATREFMLMFMEMQAPPEVLAANPGYKAVKAFDTLIKEKRNAIPDTRPSLPASDPV